MRIVQADALDSLDDYRLVEAATPAPGPGQVRIRVKACGVGYDRARRLPGETAAPEHAGL